MGHCLSKNEAKSNTDDNQPTLTKKQAKEKRKFKRFFRFFRRSNKVGVAPEDSDSTDTNGNTSSQTTLSEHGSLKSNDEQVNDELMRLTNGNSKDTIPSTNHPPGVRRLPPIGNNSSMQDANKSTNEILEELRESGVIANPKPGLSGCSFDIVDRIATPVQELPRSLSRLERGEDDDDDLKDGQARARLQRKLTNAEERRKRFLLLRKEALAARKTNEAFQQKVAEEREALDIQAREKQQAAEQRRQDQLLQKPKRVNVEEVQKKAEEINESVREKAQKSMDKKAKTAEHVLMKKEHKQRLNTMSNNLHGNAVRRRKKENEDQIKSDLEREVELDDSYFAPEQQYDL